MVSIQRVFVPTCLFLCSQLAFSVVSAEPSFSHETNLLIDISKADFDPTDVEEAPPSSAERMLATWSFQYEMTPRWSMAGNLKAFRGDNGEQLTDNIQGISNIDAERFSKIYEWYMQYQWSDDTRVKCGQVDANLEFAVVPVAGGFISPPLGITPTAIALPTYYDPALSCSVFYEPSQGFQAMGGVFAGRDHLNFGEQFYVLEGRYVQTNSQLVVGHWQHNGDWPLNDTEQFVAISGWYVNYQHQIHSSVTVFLGWSTLVDEVDSLKEHRLIGVVHDLPWGEQQVALMASQVTIPSSNDELLVEAYWQVPVWEQLVLQPVVQYIDQVAGTEDDAWIGTLRMSLTF